jgi:hypothetical protein
MSISSIAAAQTQQAVIEHTGSTNTPGMKVVVSPGGAAEIRVRGEDNKTIDLNPAACDRLFEDLKAFSPLSALPATHCVKSVSFGTSLYVEYNGERSPDLSCPPPPGSKVAQLQKDVSEIMQQVHVKPSQGSRFRLQPIPPK